MKTRSRQPEPTEEQLSKMREARKQEQASNPHYLKTNNNNHESFVNHSTSLIPIHSEDSNLIQEIPGLISSNSYFYKNDKSSSNKKKHKKRKSKRHQESSSEEEPEANGDNKSYQIQVNRGKGELPEGAEESDGDGSDIRNDLNDPHRALDINLDEPLRDEERLPAINQYLISPPAKIITTPKKKKSSKKDTPTVNQVGNLLGTDDYMEVEDANSVSVKKKKKSKDKEEKSKKSKGKKKKTSTELTHSKEGYEQPQGISTPSKEVFQNAPPSFPSLFSLGSNKDISMEYLVQSSDLSSSKTNEITILLILHNHYSSLLKNIEVNISHSPNYHLINQLQFDSSSVRLLPELSSGSRQECKLILKFSDSCVSHKIRGTLSYISQNKDGSTEDKMDFWLVVPITAFIYPAQLSGSLSFTELLSSGSLHYKHTESVPVTFTMPFNQALDHICSKCRLSVMETVDKSASLYGRIGDSVHICLLLKSIKKTNSLSIEIKTNSSSLGSYLIQEITQVVSSFT